MLLTLCIVVPLGAAAQGVVGPAQPVEARVWLDRGDEPILQYGERVRVYYRTALDAYVAVFHIDTDGVTRLIFPRSPGADHYARGGRDYRLLFPRSPYWFVDEQPGLGYFFIVASPEPFDFSAFRFSPYGRGWDLSLVGRQVYRDPYVAMDDYVAALVTDWEVASYALDFTGYHVGERYEYPRFLCYDCHGFRSYPTWNPYYAACTTFRVVIYDDPYFYPARRYRADRVVWTRPLGSDRPRFTFKERANGEPVGPLIRSRMSPPPAVVTSAPRRSPTGGAGGVVTGPARAPVGGTLRPPANHPLSEPTNLGVFRGRRSAPAYARPAEADARGRSNEPTRSGVVGPPPRGASPAGPATAPGSSPADERRAAPRPGDERLRPVLRKRPSDGAKPPDAPRSSGARPAARPRGVAPVTAQPPRRPATPPPAQPGGSSGERGSRPQARPGTDPRGVTKRSGGDREAPTVRRTPDGRPVIRR